MSEYSTFIQRASRMATNEVHRRKIQRAIHNYNKAVAAGKTRQFRNWQDARRQAAEIKARAMASLPELLETFEQRITERGARVLWAETAAEARQLIGELFDQRQVKMVVKSKSMTTEEIALNSFLEERNIAVHETDLGEMIVQLAGEKPYHIVTPAMHKSREEIAKLFQRQLGTPPNSAAEDLTMAARAFLRDRYVQADAGITGANFILAEDGALSLTENEGNGRLTMACPKLHVVIAGIEKVLPSMADLPLFLPLLATSGTGQQVSCYNSIIRGPKSPNEIDGPEEMVVILLDNGRSELYACKEFQPVLHCIRCGACLNACPVYRSIGGHAYGSTYQGPIGSLLTPFFSGLGKWQHLPQACSLCGACARECPVDIPLSHLLLRLRGRADQAGVTADFWKNAIRLWALGVGRRRRFEWLLTLSRPILPAIRHFLPEKLRRRIPDLPPCTFARWWKKDGKGK